MDKLITYINNRSKKFGHITKTEAITSIYYHIGDNIIRISDHLKYGAENVKKFSFTFIIQNDGTYIFCESPARMKDGKMYVKSVSYNEARQFIRHLHDYTISYNKLSNNDIDNGWKTEKMLYKEFVTKYITNAVCLQSVIDFITSTYNHGKVLPGPINDKLKMLPTIYKNLSIEQYKRIISKLSAKTSA